MIAFTDFLANNYLWFLVISLFLIFSLIGYLVDQADQKKGLSIIVNKPKEPTLDIHELADHAENKSINAAVSDAMKKDNSRPNIPNQVENVNTIKDTKTPDILQGQNNNPVGFDVLTK